MAWSLILFVLFLAPLPDGTGVAPEPAPAGMHARPVFIEADSIVDFGSVTVGLVRDTVVRIFLTPNNRNPITLRKEGTGTEFFAVGPLPATTSGFDTLRLPVRFVPALGGNALHRCSLVITQGEDSIAVELIGRGSSGLRIEYPLDSIGPGRDTIDFGEVLAGDCDSVAIVLSNATQGTIDVVHRLLSQRPGAFRLPLTLGIDTLFLAAQEKLPLPIIFCPLAEGDALDSMRLWTPSGYRIIYLQGRGVRAEPDIRVGTRFLEFASPGPCPRDTFVIENRGTGPLDVELELAGASGFFEIVSPAGSPIKVEPQGSKMVIVEYCGPAPATGTILVRSNDTSEPLIRVEMSIRSTSPLTPVPDFLFGVVRKCSTMSAVLKNRSAEPVRIDSIFLRKRTCGFRLELESAMPIVLEPEGTIELRVTYCARCGDADTLDFITIAIAGFTSMEVELKAYPAPEPVIATFPLDRAFRTLDSGRCDTMQIALVNVGGVRDTFSIGELQILDGGVLTIVDPKPNDLLVLDPGATTIVTLRYCPDRPGDTLRALLSVEDGTRRPLVVTIGGRSSPGKTVEPVEERTIRLDTTSATAGDLLTLDLLVSPPVPANRRVNRYDITLRFDPKALYPVGAFDLSTGGSLAIDRLGTATGTLRLATNESAFTGDSLVRVQFRGLSTGEDSNFVRFVEGTFDSVTLRGGSPGLVVLFGCDIGRPTALSRRATIRNVSLDGTDAILRFIAPEGSIALLRLTSSAGEVVGTMELPVSSSGEQTAPVDLAGLAPGFYILELRVDDGRSTIPLMIAR